MTTENTVAQTPSLSDAAPIADERPTVPGYEILDELGRGGMGVVYKARQVGLNRVVALKMLLSQGRQACERFRYEAEAVARLQHSGIVQVYAVGGEGVPFLAMEFVEGGSLADAARDRPMSFRETAEVVEKIARAVHFAHERGIVHRDLKPANVLMAADGTPKVADFGLAKRLDGDSNLTASGIVLGTPSYMSPEQARCDGASVTIKSDVYALGAILFDLLAGRPPLVGDGMADMLRRVAEESPEPPSRHRPGVPRDLDIIALKCLEKDPARRYDCAEALADDLGRWLRGESIAARAPTLAAVVRGWVRKNFGAFGWALPLGVGYGLIASAVLWSIAVLPGLKERADAYDALPSLPRPIFVASPNFPPLFNIAFVAMGLILAGTGGLVTAAAIRPRNRSADVAAGLATGSLAAATFFVGGGWWFAQIIAVRPSVADLNRLADAADGRDDGPLLAAFPDLAGRERDGRSRVVAKKIATDLATALPLANLVAVAMVAGMAIPFFTIAALVGGHALRSRGGFRAALAPFLEVSCPTSIAGSATFDGLAVYPILYGSLGWFTPFALAMAAVAGLAAVAAARRWPWPARLALHAAWLVAFAFFAYTARTRVFPNEILNMYRFA